jgi:hypothetical protein
MTQYRGIMLYDVAIMLKLGEKIVILFSFNNSCEQEFICQSVWVGGGESKYNLEKNNF